jgi:MerR family transcriptional regulator/heat shock protein HspR
MTIYTRRQILELLNVEEDFLVALEQEEVIEPDGPEPRAGEFSERMLERVRVACTLVNDLDVNLAGVVIIVRMREEIGELRDALESALERLRSGGRGP